MMIYLFKKSEQVNTFRTMVVVIILEQLEGNIKLERIIS